MRILMLNNQHYVIGGAHNVYFNTAELLKKNGHDVGFFSSHNDRNLICKNSNYFYKSIDYKNDSLFTKIKYAYKFVYNTDSADALEKFVVEFKPDIAHVHLFYGGLTVSALRILKKHQIPIVHTVHDYRLLCPNKTFFDKNQKICERCKDGKTYNCVIRNCSDNILNSISVFFESIVWKIMFNPLNYIDKFIFVSKFIQNKHNEYNAKFISKGVHLYNFSTNTSDDIKYTHGEYMLYFGRLSKEKGVENMLSVFSRLKSKLIIAGDGPLRNLVEEYQGKFKNIIFVGFKKDVELKELITNCSFVLVPSIWYDNNPMTIIESFALGKPVIGSNIGGIPELLSFNNGLVFNYDNNDELERTINYAANLSDFDYLEMSKRSFEFYENNFNDFFHYENIVSIYNDLLKKNGSN